MASANYPITTELISDYAGGRLDAEDVRVIEEAIDHDEAIATAVAAARKVNSQNDHFSCKACRRTSHPRARGASDYGEAGRPRRLHLYRHQIIAVASRNACTGGPRLTEWESPARSCCAI